MSGNWRRHRASRDAPVILVIGSPETIRQTKPPKYPHQRREHWTGPPKRRGKADVLREFMRRIAEQDETARSILRPDAAALKAWLSGAALAA